MDPTHSSLDAALERADVGLDQAAARLLGSGRTDVAGLPAPAVALLLARAHERGGRPMVVLAPDNERAASTARDLRLFTGAASTEDDDAPDQVLFFPAYDQSPFVDVAPDRRAAMDRLTTLHHLASGLPWRFLVLPLAALARRVPPREALLLRSMVIRAEEELDRDALVDVLVQGGYVRVPVVEDPGTFAVRGALIDIFPPSARAPARIELDDWLVLSIKRFEPDDQRTLGPIDELSVHPVRDALYGPEELARAKTRIRELCDRLNVPTRAARQLLEDLESGRLYLGIEAYLPGFYEQLDDLLAYLPEGSPLVLLDPTRATEELYESIDRAARDHEAKEVDGAPVFPFDAHYLPEGHLAERVLGADLTVVHPVAVSGRADEGEEGPFAAAETVAHDAVLRLGAEDQALLVAELKARRQSHGRDDALAPLAQRARRWLEQGLRVVFTARTVTQAQRLRALLKGYDVPVETSSPPFDTATLRGIPPGRVQVLVGDLSAGFLFPAEALAVVTEEEIFGTRARRKRATTDRAKARRAQGRAFIEDLRQLKPGDYVVHADHGVGTYLGLEQKRVGLSKDEQLRGLSTAAVEVLVVEYAKGDKLFLPVTRLHQLQKYSGGEGQRPKIDRLGGQTFAKTKARVQKHVKQMAEELLRLYAERLAHQRPPLEPADRGYDEFEATFPFEETPDQATAIEDVLTDLEGQTPMDRIVCGDGGFGKTEVAVRAAFRVANGGRQVAVLCPTTVLAQQHFNTFRDRLRDYPLRVEVLSRFVDRKGQSEVLAATKEGKVDILVGTHRLLSKDVHFKQLGLLVVDEEQRFGVTHKERIKKLRSEVDVLTLTATPIPRTLQLAVGGLRDLSLITTAPVDRRAVRTVVTRWDDHLIKEAIQRELARGGQCFFVYNRIEGLYERAQRLQDLVPEARFAIAHGQLAEGTLERTMTDFVDGAYDVLCSTAIIESGLDIPRANTILIDRADLFGLAQLYQLRGRVGRSKERAYCFLLTPPPSQMTDEARARIEALERFSQLGAGFSVASLDMELRGAGDVLGGEQSGNVAAVGFDLFLHMLHEAVAELRGEPIVHDVDTELTVDVEHFLPDTYVEDVGLRLSFYKRFAAAEDEQEVADLAAEMEDRFGPPPPVALAFVRAMGLRPPLRALRVLGCEATARRVTLHLREDTPLDPAKVMKRVARRGSPWKLTPDMKLTRRFREDDPPGSGFDRLETLLGELEDLRREDPDGESPALART
ncbi:MAG: transcription-repair coupling factor [Sandaracinaceae bacterium]